jgi:hypothetical protein
VFAALASRGLVQHEGLSLHARTLRQSVEGRLDGD